MLIRIALVSSLVLTVLLSASIVSAADPLPSWRDGATKERLLGFVEQVTDPASAQFIEPEDRIATFDNDGTLWSEQPMYFQLFFILDRVQDLAADHPEWQELEPFASVLKGNIASALKGGEAAMLTLMEATSTGMSVSDFQQQVNDWISTARHPTTGRAFTQMVYAPMLEALEYLRAHDFKTYIVSGGGKDFMRPWTETVYGIPPEQVIGSTVKTELRYEQGKPVIYRLPAIDFIDDKEGKPLGIHNHIGRRPVIAFGNSDGDLAMLQWTAAGEGARLPVYIHHTDAEREWAYDRESSIGHFDRGLDIAQDEDWLLVDMKRDWSAIYPEAAE